MMMDDSYISCRFPNELSSVLYRICIEVEMLVESISQHPLNVPIAVISTSETETQREDRDKVYG